jgi:hypothetical protein
MMAEYQALRDTLSAALMLAVEHSPEWIKLRAAIAAIDAASAAASSGSFSTASQRLQDVASRLEVIANGVQGHPALQLLDHTHRALDQVNHLGRGMDSRLAGEPASALPGMDEANRASYPTPDQPIVPPVRELFRGMDLREPDMRSMDGGGRQAWDQGMRDMGRGNGDMRPMGNGDIGPMGNGDIRPMGNGDMRSMGNGDMPSMNMFNGDRPAGAMHAIGNGDRPPNGNGQMRAMGNGGMRPNGNGNGPMRGAEPAGAPGVQQMLRDILRREGGYANHPNDRGGPTKFGITLRTLANWRRCGVDADDVRNLGVEEAEQIYLANYFRGPGIDRLPQRQQPLMFDMSINHGPATAVKLLQRTLCEAGYPCQVDGGIGNETVECARHADQTQGDRFVNRLVDQRVALYRRIAQGDPSQRVFLAGWMRRANEFTQQA